MQEVGHFYLPEIAGGDSVPWSLAFSSDSQTLAIGGARATWGLVRFLTAAQGQETCTVHDRSLGLPHYDCLNNGATGRCIEVPDDLAVDATTNAAALSIPAHTVAKFNGTTTIGGRQLGTLLVERGAGVDANDEVFVGRFKESHGRIVLHEGARWRSKHYVTVGDSGYGELQALAGTSIESTRIHVGFEETSQGSIDLRGPGTGWTSNTVCVVGGFGHGRVQLSGGARFLVERDITIAHRERS